MPYVLLGTAIVLEIIATTLLKSSEGFTKLLPAVFCILFYILCFFIIFKSAEQYQFGSCLCDLVRGRHRSYGCVSAAVFGEKLN